MAIEFIYLASASPRRRELLQQIGVPFQVLRVEVDESAHTGEAPADYVERLARSKSAAGARLCSGAGANPVLAADTTVVLDGEMFGKPRDEAEGIEMLRRLGGRTHTVLTAIAVSSAAGLATRLSQSEVRFRSILPEEARAYWRTGEPADKAGGYAVQGFGAVFVAQLRGSYSGVMGLPLYETAELLDVVGAPRWKKS